MTGLKNIFHAITLLTIITAGTSCSPRSSSLENHVAGALPESWYTLPEMRSTPANDSAVQPDQRTDSAVRNAFKSYTGAFSELAPPLVEDPSGRVPWHLDGMIADFAVSTNGIFGGLLSNGTYGLRATWQQQRLASPASNSQKQKKKSALKIGPQTTAGDVARQLEPAVSAAVAAGLVQRQYESAFRANLFEQAERFRQLCGLLSATGFDSGWKVAGFQLQLTFSASGQVTPLIGLGGAFNLFFDWQKVDGDAPAAEVSATGRDMSQFTRLIAAEISEALAQTPEVAAAGLRLQQVQLGLGLSAGGDIGIAQAQAGIQGKVIFKRQKASDTKNPVAAQRQDDGFVNLIGSSPKPEHLTYATRTGTEFQRFKSASGQDEVVYRIQRPKFRNGLKRALKMAGYFGKKAIEADSQKWKLIEIEAELDISIGGDLAVAVVNGTGQVVLDFDLKEATEL